MLFDNRYKNVNIVSRSLFWIAFKVKVVVNKIYKIYNDITRKLEL